MVRHQHQRCRVTVVALLAGLGAVVIVSAWLLFDVNTIAWQQRVFGGDGNTVASIVEAVDVRRLPSPIPQSPFRNAAVARTPPGTPTAHHHCALLVAANGSGNDGQRARADHTVSFDFSTDCDGIPLVSSSEPNKKVVDALRTCTLPQYGVHSCADFLGDGECDVAQYSAGIIEGKGRKKKKALLKRSPNFNCTRFGFDGGDCVIEHQGIGKHNSSGGGSWARFRRPKVKLHTPAAVSNTGHSNTRVSTDDNDDDDGHARAMCMTVRSSFQDDDSSPATVANTTTTVSLYQPVSSQTGVRSKFLQCVGP